ncbi:hypothetical protein WA158_001985 [Blastocystis sp. Blastoise]
MTDTETTIETTQEISQGIKRSTSDVNESSTPGTDSLLNDDGTNYKKAMHRASEQRRRQKLNAGLTNLEKIILATRKFSNHQNMKLDKISLIENTISYIRELERYSKYLIQSYCVPGPISNSNYNGRSIQNLNQMVLNNYEYIDVSQQGGTSENTEPEIKPQEIPPSNPIPQVSALRPNPKVPSYPAPAYYPYPAYYPSAPNYLPGAPQPPFGFQDYYNPRYYPPAGMQQKYRFPGNSPM